MSRSPAFQFYPSDWIAKTRHLSDPAYRAFMDLSFWLWLHSPNQYSMADNNKAWQIATGLTDIERMLNVRSEIMCDEMPLLKKKLGRIEHEMLRKEYEKQERRRVQTRKAAIKSVESRRNAINECSANVSQEVVSHVEREANPSSSSSSSSSASQKKKRKRSVVQYGPDFEQLWMMYVKKQCSKINAFKEFNLIEDVSLETMLKAIESQKQWRLECAQKGVFAPAWLDLERWLKRRMWEMDLTMPGEEKAKTMPRKLENPNQYIVKEKGETWFIDAEKGTRERIA